MAESGPSTICLLKNDLTRIITVQDFSKIPAGVKIKDQEIFHKRIFVKLLQIRVYPWGKGHNKEFVSVMIRRRWIPNYPLSFHCTVSIIDEFGKSRWFSSFGHKSCGERSVEDIGIEKYISRFELLNDSTGLLHEDTLTLQCELSYTIESSTNPMAECVWNYLNLFCEWFPKEEQNTWTFEIETSEGNVFPLNFETGKRTLGSKLIEASEYFQTILDAPMMEKRENKVRLRDVDCDTLNNFMGYFEREKLVVKTLEEACDLFIMADRYIVGKLKRDCSNYLAKNMNSETIAGISILAFTHNGVQLMSEIVKYFRNKEVMFVKSLNDVKNILDRSDQNVMYPGVNKVKSLLQIAKAHSTMVIDRCNLVSVESLLEVYDLYEIANKYDLMDLLQECRRCIIHNIRAENIKEIYNLTKDHEDYELLVSVSQFISTNKFSFFKKGNWDIVHSLEKFNQRHDVVTSTDRQLNEDDIKPISLDSFENIASSGKFEFYQ